MKKLVSLLGLLLMAAAPAAKACDACGCGIGSYQFGILPQFNKNFAGIRYQHKTDQTTPVHGSQSCEIFQTTELWARFYPLKRVQVFAFVPYSVNRQTSNEKTTTVRGIGDVLLLANYTLLNNTDSLYQPVKHNLMAGGGIKMATGNYQNRSAEGVVLNPNLQLGSGSFDFVGNVIYTIRYNKIGFNTDVTYRHNTQNKNNFKFGNKIGASAKLFTVIKVKESAFMPNLGLSTEHTAKDRDWGKKLTESGGSVSFATFGTEAYYQNIVVGGSFQKPVSQHVSDGYVETGNRVLAHFTVMF